MEKNDFLKRIRVTNPITTREEIIDGVRVVYTNRKKLVNNAPCKNVFLELRTRLGGYRLYIGRRSRNV